MLLRFADSWQCIMEMEILHLFLGDVENRVVRSDDETLLLSMADVLMVFTGHIVKKKWRQFFEWIAGFS